MKSFYLNRKSNKKHCNTWRKEWGLVNNVILNVLQNLSLCLIPIKVFCFVLFFKATTRADERVNMNVFCAL